MNFIRQLAMKNLRIHPRISLPHSPNHNLKGPLKEDYSPSTNIWEYSKWKRQIKWTNHLQMFWGRNFFKYDQMNWCRMLSFIFHHTQRIKQSQKNNFKWSPHDSILTQIVKKKLGEEEKETKRIFLETSQDKTTERE